MIMRPSFLAIAPLNGIEGSPYPNRCLPSVESRCIAGETQYTRVPALLALPELRVVEAANMKLKHRLPLLVNRDLNANDFRCS